jgi:hypothetical protein
MPGKLHDNIVIAANNFPLQVEHDRQNEPQINSDIEIHKNKQRMKVLLLQHTSCLTIYILLCHLIFLNFVMTSLMAVERMRFP